jgi:DNA mismatch repair protein MutS2
MTYEPSDFLVRLEFDKIIELIANNCLGNLGIEQAHLIAPELHLALIEKRLNEVSEFMRGIQHADTINLSNYEDIRDDLKMLAIEDYVLPEEGFKRISKQLYSVSTVYRYFTAERTLVYPNLYNIIKSLDFDFAIAKEIDKVLDSDGNIRPDASPELGRIRRSMQFKMKELDKVFRQIIQDYRGKGWLTDNLEGYRNGRRVLSVPSEHKRKIRGIIHDESATGRTTFIEPEGVIDINNDVFDLEQEERKEIYRILKALSAFLRPYAPGFKVFQDVLIQFDLIQAKSRVSLKLKSTKPIVKDLPMIKIYKGRHPLLFLKNVVLGKPTVPFSLTLGEKNRILVLSGPNAGGKSITMKSLGLLQLMVQSGLPVPADPLSEFGIFNEFFADIGDQQSIEDDLSTYSSRLINMNSFIRKSGKKSLLLIDEFGSGTDPQFGGAIAESILRELNTKEVVGVITTHYSNLKIFAYNTEGIINGCMAYDMDNLTPTYHFIEGKPGSSYAFEIASKSGLPDNVITYAQSRTRKSEKEVDELLVDLQKEKQTVRDSLVALKEKQDLLDKLVRGYESMQKDYEFRRKRFKLEQKQQELQDTGLVNKEVERLIKEIKEEKNIEKARELAIRLREERAKKVLEVEDLKEELYYGSNAEGASNILKMGDYVRLRSGGAVGLLTGINKEKANVLMGDLTLIIDVRDLEKGPEPLDKKLKSLHFDTIQKIATFENKLDIRGMRMQEALQVVESYIDSALMNSSSQIEIIHGKGDGILRKAVRKKLKEYRVEMEISHPDPKLGGDGVTLVAIK